ncbi:hypothetical protein D3C80_1642990 [compost metagenome]
MIARDSGVIMQLIQAGDYRIRQPAVHLGVVVRQRSTLKTIPVINQQGMTICTADLLDNTCCTCQSIRYSAARSIAARQYKSVQVTGFHKNHFTLLRRHHYAPLPLFSKDWTILSHDFTDLLVPVSFILAITFLCQLFNN